MNTKTIWSPYEIRWARPEEWRPVMRMIWRTFMKFEGKEYSEEGIRNFFYFITGNELYTLFLRGEYLLMVALDEGNIIGAGSVRNRNHLSLLFVDENYHRMGVGCTILEKLCEYLKTEVGERYMSVQAAPYAVNFYRKQGFRTVRPEMEYGGIRVTLMEKIF
ncbi:GNAT family N-acetyltransferase [Acetatifactor muris]|uniref:GNAT family N-acetyltransferase n=1 Tax=Acetatifactor muris TaxID=879566 RepID=UPI0023F04447|nr:GNAT family N-acetyltransferase [Acetatifactor muris]MCI8799414.1 GNAT family N-acetyltransferase [Lachnospiraceae bacterium]